MSWTVNRTHLTCLACNSRQIITRLSHVPFLSKSFSIFTKFSLKALSSLNHRQSHISFLQSWQLVQRRATSKKYFPQESVGRWPDPPTVCDWDNKGLKNNEPNMVHTIINTINYNILMTTALWSMDILVTFHIKCNFSFLVIAASSCQVSVYVVRYNVTSNGWADLATFSRPIRFLILIWHIHLRMLLNQKSLGYVKLDKNTVLHLLVCLFSFLFSSIYLVIIKRKYKLKKDHTKKTNECLAQHF